MADENPTTLPPTEEHQPATKPPMDVHAPTLAPTEHESTYDESLPELAGEQVLAGRYILRDRIGEGGMGAVFIADQIRPVKRKVAIKLIKAGMATKDLLARFEAERQALALMDHPNIAKVLDAGLTDEGGPFFVMEYVPGKTLIQFCDEQQLTPRQRLELFVPVCQAVQHAHQKGIVHRDLKPGNIIVTLYDGKPVPKVIDFGVAKAMSGKIVDAEYHTHFGALVGTLEYMSPEQAGAASHDIDTRSDIYSLGIILYELLTGLRPFDAARLKQAAFDEMLRIVREEEPSRPSTRLSTADALPSLAAVRQTEPAKLTALLRGDLDWIIMKCLEKDRNRRYETANGLARDVGRYLLDETVEARPPSNVYRVQKFVKRNKGRVAAAAALAVALVAGIIGTSFMYVRAETARGKEAEQRTLAEANARLAEAETAKALDREKEAIEANQRTFVALQSFTDDLMEKQFASKAELTENEKSILRNALKQWEIFAQSKGETAAARAVRADGAYRVGLLQSKLGMLAEAEGNFRNAVNLQERLASDGAAPQRADLARDVNSLATLLRDTNKRTEADPYFRMAIAANEALVAENPAEPKYRRNLALNFSSFGVLLAQLDKKAEAEERFLKALALRKALVAESPSVPGRLDLATSYNNLGLHYEREKKWPVAEENYQQAIAVSDGLAADNPEMTDLRANLARDRHNFGNLLFRLGKKTEAKEQHQIALRINDKLAADYPAVPKFRAAASLSRNNLATVTGDLGARPEAEELYRTALLSQEKLIADFPTVTKYQFDYAASCGNLGKLLSNSGKPADSVEWFDRAIRTLSALFDKDLRNVEVRYYLRNNHWDRAEAMDKQSKASEATKDWEAAVELSVPMERPTLRAPRAVSWVRAGRTAEAVAEVAELSKAESWKPEQWIGFARIYAIAAGRMPEKNEEYGARAVVLLNAAVKAGWKEAGGLAADKDFEPIRGRDDFKGLK